MGCIDPFNLVFFLKKKYDWIFAHVFSSLPALKDSPKEQIKKI